MLKATCFNSSVGILSVGTSLIDRALIIAYEFQFLSRNSVRWDCGAQELELILPLRFNSSVGILSVGTVAFRVYESQ